MILQGATSNLADARLRGVFGALRAAGHRVTPQREAIARALVLSDRHPGVDEIFNNARAQHAGMSRATVYKTLDILKASGEVLELEFRGQGNRYDGLRPHPHPHLVCTTCGAIEDLADTAIADTIKYASGAKGFRLSRYRLDLYGLCPKCQDQRLADRTQ